MLACVRRTYVRNVHNSMRVKFRLKMVHIKLVQILNNIIAIRRTSYAKVVEVAFACVALNA